MRPAGRLVALSLAVFVVSGLPIVSPSSAIFAASTPPAPAEKAAPAQELFQKAVEAAGVKRNVLVLFHASWCGWCRRLEKYTRVPEVTAILDRHYAVLWLTVDERGDRKALDNPGADEVRNAIGGKGDGLPVYAAFDRNGKVLGSSVRRGLDGKEENIGFPRTPDEIEHFFGVLRSGAPRLSAAEEASLRKALVALLNG